MESIPLLLSPTLAFGRPKLAAHGLVAWVHVQALLGPTGVANTEGAAPGLETSTDVLVHEVRVVSEALGQAQRSAEKHQVATADLRAQHAQAHPPGCPNGQQT